MIPSDCKGMGCHEPEGEGDPLEFARVDLHYPCMKIEADLRARLAESEGREQALRSLVRDYWQKLHRQTCRVFCCKGHDRNCAHPRPPALAADQPATTEPLEGVKGPARFIVYKDHQIVLSCLKDEAPEILAEMVTTLRRYAADESWEYQGHTGPSPDPPYWVWRGSDDAWPEQHAQHALERLEAQQEQRFSETE